MKKKLYGIIALVVIAILTGSSLTLFIIPQWQKWKCYENEEFGYKIKVPREWKLGEEKERIAGKEQEIKEFFASFNRSFEDGLLFFNITATIRPSCSYVLSAYRQEWKVLEEDENAKIGDLPAKKKIYLITKSTGEKFKRLDIWTWAYSTTYQITCFAPEKIHEKYIDLVNHSISSFRLLNRPEWLGYESEEFGFKLQYRADWNKIENKDNNSICLRFSECHPFDKEVGSVLYGVDVFSSNKSINELNKDFIPWGREWFTNFNCEIANTSLDGRLATKRTYTLTYTYQSAVFENITLTLGILSTENGGGRSEIGHVEATGYKNVTGYQKGLQILTKKGERVYALCYSVSVQNPEILEEKFQRYLNGFSHLKKSFEIT
jgi:hypothetical protein